MGCDQAAPGLRVHVTLDAGLRATCVRLRVHTSGDAAAPAAEELALVRSDGDQELVVAVYRDDLPKDVWLAVQPLYGTGCEAATLRANGVPAVVPAAFPAAGLTTLEVGLAAPPRSEDGDGDGFAGNGGPDCLDGDPAAHPEAAERCQEPVDADCDGRVGCADPGCSPTACLEVPEALAFVGAPEALTAGACSSPVVVETRTLAGAPKAVSVATAIAFASPDGTLNIFSDASCANGTAQAVVPAGTARAQVHVRGTQVGQGTLQATAPGLAPISQAHPILAGPASSLVYVTAPQTVTLGLCSPALTVQLRDAFGNPAPAVASRTVTFSSTAPATTRFYRDSACGTGPVNSLDIPAGEHSLTFHFRSTATAPGTVTLTADTGAGTLTVNQTQNLVQRTPTRIAFSSPPVSVPEGQCSGALTIEAQDASGGAAPVPASTGVSLSAVPSTLTFYPDTACGMTPTGLVTIPNGAAQVQFSFIGASPGSPTITASTTSLGTATQTETVTQVMPTRLVFATPEKTVTADQCSGAVTVETRDASMVRPVLADTTVSFTDTAPVGTFTLYLGNACGGTPITSAIIPAGSSAVTVSFRATRPPGVDLTASAPSLTPVTQPQTVTAGAPAALVFTSTAQTVIESTCSAPATVELRDAYGNVAAAATGGVSVALGSTFGGNLTFHGLGTCSGGSAIGSVAIPAGSSTASFFFRSTQVGSPTLTATPGGGGITAAMQVQTIAPAPPTELAFATSPITVQADQCSGPVTVETRDAVGPKPVLTDTTVSFTSTAPGGTFTLYAGGSCMGSAVTAVVIPNGSSTGTVSFRATSAGQPDLTATAGGLSPATQRQTITPGPPAALAFLGSPQSVAAATCSAQATVELRDAFGNPTRPASNLRVDLASSFSSGFNFYTSAANCTGNSPATFVTITTTSTTALFFFKGTQAGTGTIDGTTPTSGIAPASQGVTITSGLPVSLTFANGPTTVTAGACSPLMTLEARDASNNLAPAPTNITVTLSATLAGATFYPQASCGGTAGPTVVLAQGTSSVSFSFRITTAGSGSVDSASSLGNDSVPVMVNPAAPAALGFVGAPITVNAGVCSGTVRPLAIRLQDTFGNPVPRTGGPLTVTLTPEAGSGLSLHTGGGCGGGSISSVTIANGSTTSENFTFRSNVAGSWDITASGGGYTDAVQTETVNPGPPAALAFISPPKTVAVNGCSGSPPVQIQVRDTFGNPSPVTAATTVTITPASGEYFDKSMCQSSGMLVNDELILPGGMDTASFYFKAPAAAGPYDITVSSPPLAPATQTQTIQ
jgi:hypothetical protein